MYKLSVVIPVYNTEQYLPRCIESLINQTYKNIEFIFVNDCSPKKCRGNYKRNIRKRIAELSMFTYEKNRGLF